jgi:hypothetical protein
MYTPGVTGALRAAFSLHSLHNRISERSVDFIDGMISRFGKIDLQIRKSDVVIRTQIVWSRRALMIISPGDSEAFSFNDDSSPDTRKTLGLKVSIDAQVIREHSLDWYFQLIALFMDVPGELKSEAVFARFNVFPASTRARVWAGLSKVRIHIVDPRPYVQDRDDLLRKVWRSDDAPELLRQAVVQNSPWAKYISRELQRYVAGSILNDSTAARLHRYGWRSQLDSMLFETQADIYVPPPIELHHFGEDQKSLVRKVSTWSVKSAAAFHGPLDGLDSLNDEAVMTRFALGSRLSQRAFERLFHRHAFDKGDEHQIRLLEEARLTIIRTFADQLNSMLLPRQSGFLQVESRESFCGQAADLAAGMASRVYAESGLPGVVSHFEYVTYNGTRVGTSDADEEERRCRFRR